MKLLAFPIALILTLCASRAESQTFTTLARFTGTGGTASGEYPFGSLTLVGSNLYGMTSLGGAYGDGNIFSVGTNGANYQNLVSFNENSTTNDAWYPLGSLTLVGSALYGTTGWGGSYGWGSVVSIRINGANYQNLVSFSNNSDLSNGRNPHGNLTLAVSGLWLYGMAWAGGTNDTGTVFSMAPNGGPFQTLVSFPPLGSQAIGTVTVVGTNVYGMTSTGGNGKGNIFSVGLNGTNYQNLVSFTGSGGMTSGAGPTGSLTLVGTRLYGMTKYGGAYGDGNIFSIGMDGTGYQNLDSFGTVKGSDPYGSLILSGTTLYGMTILGGRGYGLIFSMGIDGSAYQDLHDFSGVAGDAYPHGDLLLSGGTLFGMTTGEIQENSHDSGYGTVFALTLPTPEPGTLALVGCGAAALAAGRLRRSSARVCGKQDARAARIDSTP